MSAVPAAGFTTPWWALLGVLVLAGGCVDKAPPPLWPAPPPPSVATPISASALAGPASVPDPPGVVGAPALAGPSPLDAVPPDSSILDPASPAAAAVPKTGTTSPRPVPSHK